LHVCGGAADSDPAQALKAGKAVAAAAPAPAAKKDDDEDLFGGDDDEEARAALAAKKAADAKPAKADKGGKIERTQVRARLLRVCRRAGLCVPVPAGVVPLFAPARVRWRCALALSRGCVCARARVY
jgi:hypothetical protein